MKGGITSGVAYPAAVTELSQTYDFAAIGGASAGAIAATVTAAAQHAGGGGFERLQAVRAELSTPGLLVRLFQPTKETRPLMQLLLASQQPGSKRRRVLGLARQLARRLALPVAVGTAAVFACVAWMLGHAGGTWRSLDPLAWSLLALLLLAVMLLVATGCLVARAVKAVTSSLPSSCYGMCLGISESAGDDGPALTEWLHERIQWVAGRRAVVDVPEQGERPLTFEDLSPEVELRIMTTDLTRGRPVRLPVAGGDLLFSADELRALFPEDVVAFLEQSCPVVHEASEDHPALRGFPSVALPVVVATRMSLSFPVLLAAVPLWTVAPDGSAVRHWFSDGGISSNFPIHFFDAWVPSRPIFGLNLAPARPGADPQGPPAQSVHTYPDTPPAPRRVPVRDLGGFLSRILDTMQNWRDTTQAELAGFHDRIAHIELDAGEGGMNITMPAPTIARVDAKGAAAGALLHDSFNWPQHQLRRYETFMGLLQTGLVPPPEDSTGSRPRCVHDAWQAGLADLVAAGPVSSRPPEWGPAAHAATQALLATAQQWLPPQGTLSFRPDVPLQPPASMRLTPDV